MAETERIEIEETGEATGRILVKDQKPIMIIGTKAIRDGLEQTCLQQAINSRMSPGVSDIVVNPDAHMGYGAPVGCVMVSDSHIYPGPVGVDVKCSMSLLQLDLPKKQIGDFRSGDKKEDRRRLIDAICQRVPTGMGKGRDSVPKGRGHVSKALGARIAIEGASKGVLNKLGIPAHWADACEDACHKGHDGTEVALNDRLFFHLHGSHGNCQIKDKFEAKVNQVGSYGGGNHFGECEIVEVLPGERETAKKFGLKDGHVAFLSHCGSRGLGHTLAVSHFKTLENFFKLWGIPFPGGDRELVYAPLGSPHANDYLNDMAIGANFATVNHLLINALVLEAFQEVFDKGVKAELVYFISHNIARQEILHGKKRWVHRKGATRAFPARHPGLKHTPYYYHGHPILLPGNPADGSVVMVANEGAEKSCYSVNHGAGRAMGRRAAKRALRQRDVNQRLDDMDILWNSRDYPLDESPKAYKKFKDVVESVEKAGLATTVAKLKARFVIKDSDKADD